MKNYILLSPEIVYQVLYNMEREGLIQNVKSRGRRRFYSLTDRGIKWCNEMLKATEQTYNLIAFFELKRRAENMNTELLI